MENTGKSDERHQTADMVRMFKNNPAGLSAGWNRHVLPAFPRGSICWTQPWTSLNRVSSSLPWALLERAAELYEEVHRQRWTGARLRQHGPLYGMLGELERAFPIP